MKLLDTIESPADLKHLRRDRLPVLAREIRERIVSVVSRNGGHLAPSLGAVDLAIALHYVFDSLSDKFVWDVGHQSYAHKLLTGRRDAFSSLRRLGGLSGFCRISESPHDAFTTGHSSTSISAGLGMACAKRLDRDPAKVIAVIGDGSMTAGLAYEGLNQAGDLHKDENLLVILNDNDMSISANVGSLPSFLSRTFSARYLQDFRKEIGEFLKSLPKIGDDMYQLAKRSEESFKAFVTPGMLFEAFNLDYFGPIDGHNLDHLIDILSNIKEKREPVLLHVTTRKGKGYAPAEKNPAYYHGIGCFEVATGECAIQKKTVPTYTSIFGQTMVDLAASDKRIVAVTAAMPEGTGLAEFAARYPDRFFDVGIAEQHGVTFAAGMALEGFRPVVAIYSTFMQRAYDQVLHDVCIEKIPLVFALDRGGIVGEDGPTHHGLFDLSYMRSLPNMTLMAPRDERELARMLVTALAHDGPAVLRYPRGSAVGVELMNPVAPLEIGKGEVLATGPDLLLIAVGHGVVEAREAVEKLAADGIRATLVDARFIKPLDVDLIAPLVEAIPRVITVEENMRQGGFGSAVMEELNDRDIHGYRLRRIGIQDVFVAHGPQKKLREIYGVDAAAILQAAKELLEG